jgi:hypothetical protein
VFVLVTAAAADAEPGVFRQLLNDVLTLLVEQLLGAEQVGILLPDGVHEQVPPVLPAVRPVGGSRIADVEAHDLESLRRERGGSGGCHGRQPELSA